MVGAGAATGASGGALKGPGQGRAGQGRREASRARCSSNRRENNVILLFFLNPPCIRALLCFLLGTWSSVAMCLFPGRAGTQPDGMNSTVREAGKVP